MNSADKLREQLEQDIVTGALQPGDRLQETALSERFGVSRTPIREALHRLSISGLVIQYPRRGTFVQQISFPEMIEMFDVMAELEGMCSRLTARRITPEQSIRLQHSLLVCSQAADIGDTDAYYHANAEFHNVIYEACQNSFLTEQAKQLHIRLSPYRRLQIRVANRMRQSLAEHQEITQHILAGNERRAEAATKAHVAIQGERFSDLAASFQTASFKNS